MVQSDPATRKSSSTSSAYISSTISAPNVDSIIDAVATILHSQMLEDKNVGKTIPKGSVLYFFSQEKYIEEKPQSFDQARLALLREMPNVQNIYEFVKALYDCAQFSPECVIIGLVYINRLIAFTGMALAPTNWRPITICSLLVAQKVWDDRYLSNSDFAFIYPFFVTEEINHLESKFLELLEYTVTVKSSLYAKYYFELRALFKDNQVSDNINKSIHLIQKQFPLRPLDNTEAERLEIRSGKYQDAFQAVAKKKKKKSTTMSTEKPMPQKKPLHSSKFVIN